MNTQNTLISRDERRAFEAAWRAYVATGDADASAFILSALLRGRNPLRGFTPITNPVKLANGQRAWQGFDTAYAQLRRRLGSTLLALWPDLKAEGVSPERYDGLVKDLLAALDLIKRGA